MPWSQLTLDVPDHLKDAVVGELSEHGAAGVWESSEPSPGHTRLVAYFDPHADLKRIDDSVRSIFNRANTTPPLIAHSSVDERDWTEEWKKSYVSFPIGKGFFVIPSWCDSGCPEDRIGIYIDPGQAFGTGTHETTQLTLEALERWVEPHQVVLDLGTGSGILAIASRMLGAKNVFACDIDPIAAQVAYENIKRNAEHEIWTMCGSIDAVRDESMDLVLCNLTVELIIDIFPEVQRALRPNGLAIFSGILNTQREEIHEVTDRFGYAVHEEATRGEWLALVAEKGALKDVG